MIDPLLRSDVEKELDAYAASPWRAKALYGIFYKGQMMAITKARIYRQPGRAKAEIGNIVFGAIARSINKNLPYNDPSFVGTAQLKKLTKEMIDEMIKEGVLEIKQI